MKGTTNLIVMLALAAGLGFGIWYFGESNYIEESRSRNDKLEGTVKEKQKLNARNNYLREKFDQLQAERKRIAAEFVELRKRLPSEENFGEFVLAMNQAAKVRQLKLDFNGQHPPYKPGINASPLKISLITPEKQQNFTGKYSLLQGFADWLADFPQLVTIQSFKISGDGFGPLKMSLNGSMPVDIPEPGTTLE